MPRRLPNRRSRLAPRASRPPHGLTLIEMLVATAITLLMMAAVVNLFANLSGSIRNRRAVIELSGQLRQARQRLALDLAGATCPGITWQRPGDDNGYVEIVEGRWNDLYPSALVDGEPSNGEIDYATSIIPRNNLIHDDDGDGEVDDAETQAHLSDGDSLAPSGLGDYDDILALTVRSEEEPFVANHNGQKVESPLAEVVWFAVENPANGLLGEPGLRSIYRRALVIAPWLGPIQGPPDPQWFYQRHDISAHYDPTLDFNNDGNPDGGWTPNSLGDLTRREFRFYRSGLVSPPPYLHPLASGGAGYDNSPALNVIRTSNDQQSGNARPGALAQNGSIVAYGVGPDDGGAYDDLPAVVVVDASANQPAKATARPILVRINKNDNVWRLAHVTFGPAPLSVHRTGTTASDIVDRTGEDLMLTDVLAFDLRVYDPGAPLYLQQAAGGAAPVAVAPGDPGWRPRFGAAMPDEFGAYVDLGWLSHAADPHQAYFNLAGEFSATRWQGMPVPRFAVPRQVRFHPNQTPLNSSNQVNFPFGFPAVYCTWSIHYESNGIDEDNRDGDNDLTTGYDEATNNVDDEAMYPNASGVPSADVRDGPDDLGERETAPPYDTALRGVQVRVRVYERTARQIRETSVTQSLAP